MNTALLGFDPDDFGIADEPILTGRAAEIVGVTAQTLRRMQDRGKITSKRGPNGERRFSTHDCLRLAASGEDEVYRSSVQNSLSYEQVLTQYKARLQEEKNFMTADEAVIVLAVSRATLRRWEHKGRIKSCTSPYTRHTLFRRTDVAKIKKERER